MKKHLLRKSLMAMMLLAGASAFAQEAETVTVGTLSRPQGISSFPLWTYYECSESEFIYTADDLINLNPGAISKMEYAVTGGQMLYSHMTLWLENTDDTAVGKEFRDVAEMTKVYESDGDRVLDKFQDATLANPAYLGFEFAEPFEYTGGGLRVHLASESEYYCDASFVFVSDALKIGEDGGQNNALLRTGYANWSSARLRTPDRQFPIVRFTLAENAVVGVSAPVAEAPKAIGYYNLQGQPSAAAKGIVVNAEGKKVLNR